MNDMSTTRGSECRALCLARATTSRKRTQCEIIMRRQRSGKCDPSRLTKMRPVGQGVTRLKQ